MFYVLCVFGLNCYVRGKTRLPVKWISSHNLKSVRLRVEGRVRHFFDRAGTCVANEFNDLRFAFFPIKFYFESD